MSTGDMIMQYRKRARLTQERLAEQINVSRQTLAMWETSRQFPSDNVALLTARFFQMEEEHLLEQLRWDRLHQRVDQLERQYNATITVKPKTKEQNMDASHLRNIASHTIDGVTFSVRYIYKWLNFEPDVRWAVTCGPDGMVKVYQPGEFLVVSLMFDYDNEDFRLHHDLCRVEDNLGNQSYGMYTSARNEGNGQFLIGTYFPYVPEATSITLRYDAVNAHEDHCDALIFDNVRRDEKGVSRSFKDDIVTYNGVHAVEGQDYHRVRIAYNKPIEVRHVGPTTIADNLGNQYPSRGRTSHRDGSESFSLHELHPDATSISFKYLFARAFFAFELRDLPLPS